MNRKMSMVLVIFLVAFLPLTMGLGQESGNMSQQALSVTDMVLTTNVMNLEPVDTVSTFTTADEEAYCHIRVNNPGDSTTVTFRWLRNGEEYFTFNAPVGSSSSWRTYTSVTAWAGDWTIQILDPQNNVLRETSFTVSEE